MTKKAVFLSLLLSSILFYSCSETFEEEFFEANVTINQKYLKSLQIIDHKDESQNMRYIISYDEKIKISSISDGTLTEYFSYDESNALVKASLNRKVFNINDLYQAPYDAFETGNVNSYDAKGNPVEIEVYKKGFGSERLTGIIEYDQNPNPFFYTLKAGGVIDMLDKVNLYMGNPDPYTIKARQLLPYNSIVGMTYIDIDGKIKHEVAIDYTYNEIGYPEKAIVHTSTPEGSFTHTLIYEYLTIVKQSR